MGEPQRAAYGKGITCGEFVDSIIETEFASARYLFGLLNDMEEWKDCREVPLTREIVIGLANGMAIIYTSMIGGINSVEDEDSYLSKIEEGHAFLKEMHAKATKLGIKVGLEDIDQPLAPEEHLSCRGHTSYVC